MKAQTKAQSACDIAVYADKGSLALRFPKRHNALWETLDGKSLKGKPKCLGIGKYGFSADNPDDWKRANAIAIQLEADLDHPEWEKLFDPTLSKYGLGGGKYAKLAEVLQLPGIVQIEPEITVGEMWSSYLEWKKTVVEETTFKSTYKVHFSNAIKGLLFQSLDQSQQVKAKIAEITISNKKGLIFALNEAFGFCKTRDMLVNPTTENPFVLDKYIVPIITTQQKYASKIVNGEEVQWHDVVDESEAELDRRAFSKVERDIIIDAFYNAKLSNRRKIAPLIEFYFLTGCRTSEALALTWKDIDFNRNIIRFNKSLGVSTKKIKDTKTGEIRLFYFSENSRLKELLLKLENDRVADIDIVFPTPTGKYMVQASIGQVWRGSQSTKTLADGTQKTYHYPGVVTQLVEQGLVSGYLSPYHTRHTYITLTAQANSHNNNALLYIASACGNSVDVILRHYLGVNESVELVQV